MELFETKKEPRKTFQTFLRNQNKSLLSLYNVADKKSAIMIRINSTIVSAVVIFYKTIFELQYGNIICLILIISCLTSLLLALNASRPKTFDNLLKANKNKGLKQEERLFLNTVSREVDYEEYEKVYDKILRSQELQIKNLTLASYQIERNLQNTYINIELSYLAFMIGFALTGITFIISNCTVS